MDLARAPRRTARKKGSGYENEFHSKTQRSLVFLTRDSLHIYEERNPRE